MGLVVVYSNTLKQYYIDTPGIIPSTRYYRVVYQVIVTIVIYYEWNKKTYIR